MFYLPNLQRKLNEIINNHNCNLRLLRSNCDAYKRYVEGSYYHSIRKDIENNLFLSDYGTVNGFEKIQLNIQNTNLLSELKDILNKSNQLINSDKKISRSILDI